MSLDDYLGLLSKDFSGVSTVIFTGPSGSGKSSQIRLLIDAHDHFRPMTKRSICPQAAGFSWRNCRSLLMNEPVDLLIVDEICTLRDALQARKLLWHVPRQILASHIKPWVIRAAGPTVQHVDTTVGGNIKLARYLDREGIAYTEGDLERYIRRYGSVFTELEIMLETCPAAKFDKVWETFHRFHKIN